MDAGGDTRPGWDFFISYTQADQVWAEWIAWVLEDNSYRVLVQAWDMVPGTNWTQLMQAGARDATRTIAVLSDAYLESVYGGAEWQATWGADPAGVGRRLLTARVEECDRPGLLAGVVGFDLFGLSEADARARLLAMVAAAVAGRAKPARKPRFPGSGRAKPAEKPGFPGSGRVAQAGSAGSRVPGAGPRVWNVAAHNPNFTGRHTELESLARRLAGGSTITVESVRGMGGVGKTQLAIEYAHAHAGEYDVVWWVAAEETAAIPDQFTALAVRLGAEDPGPDPDALRSEVHELLRDAGGWLLIFDNADTADDIRPWLPAGPQRPGVPGHVIVTTRRGGFGSLGPVMDLDVIGLPDAVTLLRTRVPDLDQSAGEAIADELGRLPLALEQAAAYLDRTGQPPEAYLELLRTRAADLYARGQVASRKDTVATLWAISLDRVAEEDETAIQLLEICAYLAPEPVPLDLFTGHSDLLPEPLASAAQDELAFNDTLATLVDYSLAKRSRAGLQVHRLVQAATRARRDGTRLSADLPGARSQ